MNRYDRIAGGQTEAKLEYGDGEFRVVRPGSFVRCAITGQAIALDELRYWNIERQEPYASCEIATRRLLGGKPSREAGCVIECECHRERFHSERLREPDAILFGGDERRSQTLGFG